MRCKALLPAVLLAAALAACGDEPTTAPAIPDLEVSTASPSFALSGGGVSGANFTTTNPSWDRPKAGTKPELCLHGQDPQAGAINCNIYGAKPYVWLNGGPLAAGLESGTYFWAVLEPGGQPNPNDAAVVKGGKNLSDDTDPYTNRTFTWTKAGSVIAYAGTHDWDKTTNKIRVGVKPPLVDRGPDWFANTTNRGGVYILAICRISAPSSYPVDPRDCKYDAFKIEDRPGDPTAIITIEPNDVNEVALDHTFDVTVKAVGGTQPYTFAVTPVVTPAGALKSHTCGSPVVGAEGFIATCQVTVNSSAVGTVTARASALVTDANGRSTTVSTGPNALPNGDDGYKYYVDANISVTPASDVNPLNQQHTFTVTFTASPGAATPTTFNSITPALTAPSSFQIPGDYTVDANTCGAPSVSGNVASCVVKITSKKPGVYGLSATGSVTMGANQDQDPSNGLGATVVRSTDGSTTASGLANSPAATKYYAGARITLTPKTATNGITESHTVTATVEQTNGSRDGNGALIWTKVPGITVSYQLKPPTDAAPASGTCTTVTDADGKCTFTFNKATAGLVTINASTSTWNVTVGNESAPVSAATTADNKALGGTGLDEATKTYVDGSISWVKVDEEGLRLGGAEFKAERIALRAGYSDPSFVPPSPVYTGITDCTVSPCATGAGKDQDADKGEFTLTGLALGTWRVTETKAPANYSFDAAFTQTITIDLTNPPASLSGSAAQNFVNVGKYAGCTPGFWKQEQHFGYWQDSPYSPVDPRSLLSTAFSAFNGQGGYAANSTMIDALGWDNSTGVGQLLRHGVAALLNAYSTGVFYGFQDDPQNIKNAVNGALLSMNQGTIDALHLKLAKYNELGCTLSGQKFWTNP